MDLVKEAGILAQKCCPMCVSSVSDNGYPRVCVLNRLLTQGCNTIYFSTGADSIKVRHYKKILRPASHTTVAATA